MIDPLPSVLADGGLLVCFLVPVVVAVFGAIMFAAYKAEQRRRAAFEAAAAELGLHYDPSSQGDWDARWPQFECFQRGHSRRAFNILSGRLGADGPQCALGEYEFRETHGSGKNRRTVTYRFGFTIIDSGYTGIPDMLIRQENLLDKVAGFLGFDDIDFESVEFSKRYMVKCSDKRFAYDLIDAQMMEFLLHEGTPNIDLGGGAFCLWVGQNVRLEPPELVSLGRWGLAFLERWPRVLRAELDERRGRAEEGSR